ncbi:MAG: bacterio-opsin activator domain-containing protein [Halodesulfurarchaeum sp.]
MLNESIRELSAALGHVENRSEVFGTVHDHLADIVSFCWVGTLDIEEWSVEAEAGSRPELGPKLSGSSGGRNDVPPAIESAIREQRVVILSKSASNIDGLIDGDEDAVAIIPIVHQNSRYGLILVGDETEVITRSETAFADVGSIVGQAISRVEYRTAMMGGGTYVEFCEPDALTRILDGHAPPDATIGFEHTVPLPDGSLLQYVTVEHMDERSFREQVEAFGGVTNIRVVTKDDAKAVYETTYTGPSVIRTIAEHNGEVLQSWYQNRDHYTIARIPVDTSVQQVIEAVTDAFPDVEVLAQRSVPRDLPAGETKTGIRNRLTDRQRVVAETALAAGYFERPRESQAGELAETLDINTATVSQHLRAAHRKVYGSLFGHER